MGTAGGQTKGSSGYTFRFIQKNRRPLLRRLRQHEHAFFKTPCAKAVSFLRQRAAACAAPQTLPGAAIFTDLFKKNTPQQVLKFLDNETSPAGRIRIISTLPTWPFLKAAIGQQLPFG
jgi:lycopene beta-cyclase